jgi:hypothetical protein
MLKGNSNKKKSASAVQADFDDFRLDFLGEFEAETALAHESGP